MIEPSPSRNEKQMEVKEDILTFDVQYIAHQCNCLSTKSLGLARLIFDKYPHSNVYTKNTPRTPGEIIVVGQVINMFAQYWPGSPAVTNSNDTSKDRLIWFKMCLDKIKNIDGISSIAFPYKIGCGLARGNWVHYKQLIDDFAASNRNIQVFICNPY